MAMGPRSSHHWAPSRENCSISAWSTVAAFSGFLAIPELKSDTGLLSLTPWRHTVFERFQTGFPRVAGPAPARYEYAPFVVGHMLAAPHRVCVPQASDPVMSRLVMKF